MSTPRQRLRLAVQKSGRLSDKSRSLLTRAGMDCEWRSGRLDGRCLDFPLDLMLVRDDDIPQYVAEGVCDLGIVGRNVVEEHFGGGDERIQVLRPLGFGHCRLSVAVPERSGVRQVAELGGTRIATSYPNIVKRYLAAQGLSAHLVEMAGSVEIAPALGVADAVCDLVSTGSTLDSNGLRELAVVLRSEAVLVRTGRSLDPVLESHLARLQARLSGVLRAEQAKYIMMNAPAEAVDRLRGIIPGMEEPTVIPLGTDRRRVAVHAVAPEPIFWETMERLKEAGASSILVVPIEKIIE